MELRKTLWLRYDFLVCRNEWDVFIMILLDFQTKFHGSVLPNPLEYQYDATHDDHNGEHKVSASYGPKLSGQVSGKYSCHGPGTPATGSLNLQATLPNDKVQHIELALGGSVKQPQQPEGKYEVSITLLQ